MRTSIRTTTFGFALLSIAATVSAVSLASFTPRILIPTTQCQTAYTTTIEGCTPDDFKKDARCSVACAQGMVKIADLVINSCKDAYVDQKSIVGVFLAGNGIQALCPGVTVTTIASNTATSTKAQAQPSAPPKVTTTSATASSTTLATSASTTTSSSESTRQSQDTQPSSTSSGAILVDPNPTSQPPTSVQSSASSSRSSAAAKPTVAAKPQLSNTDSGGGSPFDVVAGASSQLRVTDSTVVALLTIAMLLVACA
jgi:hypothetical protein